MKKNGTMKKIIAMSIAVFLLGGICAPTENVEAATKQSTIRSAYAKVIKKNKNKYRNDEFFVIRDLDKNGVPELILYWDEYSSNSSNVSSIDVEDNVFSRELMVYTYQNGKIKKVCEGDDGMTCIGVHFKNSVIVEDMHVAGGYTDTTFCKYSKGKCSKTIAEAIQEDFKYRYIVDGKKTTEEKYYKRVKALTSGKSVVTFYKATDRNIKAHCLK